VFSVSSLTKPFVATAIMMLIEDGLLGLNRPLKEYLPEISGKGSDAIQVQHLLSHTSGYDDAACWAQFGQQISGQLDRTGNPAMGLSNSMAQYLSCLWDKPVDFGPGSELIYCNHNYALLVEIVRRISGRAPEEFMQERVFDVLNMGDSTCYRDDNKSDRQLIRGDGAPFGSVAGRPMEGHEGEWLSSTFWGYMGINSTALDLAAFGQMFLNKGIFNEKKLLSPQTVQEMTRNQTEGLTMEVNGHVTGQATFGLGWFIQGNYRHQYVHSTLLPVDSFTHSGAGGNMLWVDPANDLVGIYLSMCHDIDVEASIQRTNMDLFQNMAIAAVLD
jgi:CubicO group peptidase (beta-lactamase class C family)